MKRKTKKRLKKVAVSIMLIAISLPLFSGFVPQKQTASIDPQILEAMLNSSKKEETIEKEEPVPNMEGYYLLNKVLDGSSLSVMWGDEEKTVKLIGVTVPKEMEKKAKALLQKILSETDMIGLEFDENEKDADGKLLAYAYHPDDIHTTLNSELLANGYAKLEKENKELKYIEDLRSAERIARTKQLGCWAPEEPGGQN